MRVAARLWTILAGMLGMLAIADRPARATPPAPPVLVRLAIDGRTLHWELLAHADAALEAPAWRSVPAGALSSPPALPEKLMKMMPVKGRGWAAREIAIDGNAPLVWMAWWCEHRAASLF